MRNLDEQELEVVSGGDWELSFDLKVVGGKISGDEDVQDMAAAVAEIASSAYATAVDATADMFEWIANGWNFAASCGRG
jgi:hypothetical protein